MKGEGERGGGERRERGRGREVGGEGEREGRREREGGNEGKMGRGREVSREKGMERRRDIEAKGKRERDREDGGRDREWVTARQGEERAKDGLRDEG